MADELTNGAQGTQDVQNEQQETETHVNTQQTNNSTESQSESQNEQSLDVEKMIQRAVDRATNKLGNENKNLRKQIENLRKQNLTAEQLREVELQDREADVADRDAKLREKENRFFAITAIREAGLDDGSRHALDLVDFVMADNEDAITTKVKVFSDLVNKFVTAKVNQTFKDKGRNPENGGNKENNAYTTIAETLGKTVADRNAAANKVLEHYLGGRK